MNLEARLESGAALLDMVLGRETIGRLLQYLALIQKWNRVHNLTSVRKPETMLIRHILDSLAIVPHIRGPRIVDVGSGAGLPGIPLALARPEWQLVLVESNHKKATFLRQARIELQLQNVEIAAARIEDFHEGTFDTVVSRAFSDLADFVRLAGHLCEAKNGKSGGSGNSEEGGRMAAMKGIHPHEELAQIPSPFAVEEVIPVTVPGLEEKRHLIVIGRA